ncbi:CDP-diacylglycerol--serine O-phosphatidyltransferase [Bacillus sp. T33-2]|uniref:CDP-diacylglycerol--serine O-phosphatidyltransferase n=1 Tax=Bacillus sp. T33-2 TaxID=2054168 RepID=UPI000C75C6E4|nr:CDP-diacylglycerol--serine O-phosphatidyltransferase [Bacillus sp. T33-2]PLR95284.1 CDP-diacylglycerol--serine O-phosphatidyltransferase [Bacillus sp. T33-2]
MEKHIPNVLTLGNLYCGFLSINYIFSVDVKNATVCIFIALILDALDGRVARILGLTNGIGKELDSLADIVSFGVAPALLSAYTYFADLQMIGIIMSGLFPVFGAYRLARFNLTPQEESLKYFKGIPITIAGAIITFLVLYVKIIPLWIFSILFFGLSILMISTIKIPSLKKMNLPKNSMIIALFFFYLFYLVVMTTFEYIPVFFYIAMATYLLFMVNRQIKRKEPHLRRK